MSESPGKRKVLLIGWDAADWEVITPLLEEGLMPSLEEFDQSRRDGKPRDASAGSFADALEFGRDGKYADKHGIHGFIEPDPIERRRPAVHQHFAQMQSALEHSYSVRSAQ